MQNILEQNGQIASADTDGIRNILNLDILRKMRTDKFLSGPDIIVLLVTLKEIGIC